MGASQAKAVVAAPARELSPARQFAGGLHRADEAESAVAATADHRHDDVRGRYAVAAARGC